jgi:Cu/Ag efflux protein CusF
MKVLLLAACLALSTVAPVLVGFEEAIACGSETYSATGIIKAASNERRTLTIAHDAIPGYMGAMTMSFELGAASQAEGLVVGDRVRFTFTASDDGRRVISKIEKDAARKAR